MGVTLISVLLFLQLIKLIEAYCPAIVRKDMPYDMWVLITDDVPQNKTIYVDSCESGKVWTFGGKQNSYIWPISQSDLYSNSATLKNQYNNSGTTGFGYAQAYWVGAKELLKSSKLAGEMWSHDNECLLGYWDSGRCYGYAAGEKCTSTSQWIAGYYWKSNTWTVVVSQGSAWSSDDDWAIDCIWAAASSKCEYAFAQNENTTVNDARQWKSATKSTTSGSSGLCKTTDYVQQNSVNLTNYVCNPNSTNLWTLKSLTTTIYPENKFNDFTKYSYTVSGPLDWHWTYNVSGYWTPYGYDTWFSLHDYWKNNIVSTLKTYWHQSRRFNPVAWVSCNNGLDNTKLTYFVGTLFNLTNDGI